MASFDPELWLDGLSNHPAFSLPSGAPSPLPGRASAADSGSGPAPSNLFAIINQTRLLLYRHPEIRLLSLLDLKRASSGGEGATAPLSYKVLRPTPDSALPTAAVTRLVPNPTAQLVAVCSSTEVSVISLPAYAEEVNSKAHIDCTALRVGGGQYEDVDSNSSVEIDPSDCPRVMKVLWHEWTFRSSTILILYSSGFMHEYDISSDGRHPTQVLDFNSPFAFLPIHSHSHSPSEPCHDQGDVSGLVTRLQSLSTTPVLPTTASSWPTPARAQKPPLRQSISSQASRAAHPLYHSTSQALNGSSPLKPGTYGSADTLSTRAVSMCLGGGSGDWGPLTLYGLMRNGDLYAVCPYVPKNHSLPLSYSSSLSLFLAAKLEAISHSARDHATNYSFAQQQTSLWRSLQYLNSVSKLPQGISPENEMVNVGSPRDVGSLSFLDFRPLRQGPFLMQPSPVEMSEDEEDLASDLLYLQYSESNVGLSFPESLGRGIARDPDEASLAVLMIAYSRKVDVCLEVEKVEPRWASLECTEQTALSMGRELPVLITYECIDLGMPDLNVETNAQLVALVRDSCYADVIYAFHGSGVHAISMMTWVGGLVKSLHNQMGSDNRKLLVDTISSSAASEVAWIARSENPSREHTLLSTEPCGVAGLCVVDNAYLGYCILMMTHDGQVLTQQLRHRPDALLARVPAPGSSKPAPAPPGTLPPVLSGAVEVNQACPSGPTSHDTSKSQLYVSLLNRTWKPNDLLMQGFGGAPGTTGQKPPDLSIVNSNTFRYAVTMSKQMNQNVRKLIEAVNEGQDRLKLQLTEYKRQLEHVMEARAKLSRPPGMDCPSWPQFARLEQVEKKQAALLRRADRILQRLVDESNCTLSKEEIRWFSELQRMKTEVGGDETVKGLTGEIESLQTRLDQARQSATRESLQAIDRTSKDSQDHLHSNRKLGESQVQAIHSRLVHWLGLNVAHLSFIFVYEH